MTFIYRVTLQIGYYERYFDFTDRIAAVQFAEAIIKHDVISEDHKEKQLAVEILVMTPEEAD